MSMEISIVIPTRNNGSTIKHTLEPLFNQSISNTNYEIVVIDNGSDDNTSQVLEQLRSTHNNLLWFKEKQLGRTFARNRGIKESSGKIVLFMDDDIHVDEDHLENHLRYHVEAGTPVAVIGRVVDVSPITPAWAEDYFHERQVAGSYESCRNADSVSLGFHFATGNVSLLRSTLDLVQECSGDEKFYFDSSFCFREDADMGFRLIREGVSFVFPDDILCSHFHQRSWRSIVTRSFDAGYALVRLNDKYPEARIFEQQHVTSSYVKNLGLRLICFCLFCPALLVRTIWPHFLRKVVGALVAYHTNRGFQKALTDQFRRMG